jgi:hypothetical protein
MANPNTKARDSITAPASNASGSPKRSDTLNGSPKTKSLGSKTANYSDVSPKDKSAPPPNNPYR